MPLFISLLLLLLPTSLVYVFLLNRGSLRIKSGLLRISLAWFLGQYITTILIFVLAILLAQFTDSVLIKAVHILLAIQLLILFVYLRKDVSEFIARLKSTMLKQISIGKIIFIIICFLFSYILFIRQIAYADNKIFISPVYWDFNIHYPVIQSFVYGDNFPPENESFSGVPMTYHYFFYLLTAAYAAAGMGLVNALNLMSVLTFFFMLLGIAGLCEEIFHNEFIGYAAVIFSVTSGSFRFINYFYLHVSEKPRDFFLNIIANQDHPFHFSFTEGNPFGYNGTMFNLFYFVAERHLIFAVIFLICSLVAIYQRKKLNNTSCIIAGVLMGLFFQWNLASTIMVGCCLFLLYVTSPYRNKTLLMLAPFTALFLAQALFFKNLAGSGWFYPDVLNYPKINFNFPTMPNDYPFSLFNAFLYYLYGYGFKLLLLLLGLFLLFRKKRGVFFVFFSIIVPTFILINSVQFFPLSIWDNHKFIRPMNIFVDIIAAYSIFVLYKMRHKIIKLFSVFIFLMLILSGIIELFPFFNTKPGVLYAHYPTDFMHKVRLNSQPKSVFLSKSTKELHLAGRKVFLGNRVDEPGAVSVVEAAKFNTAKRDIISNDIYQSSEVFSFCKLIRSNHIDYVTFTDQEKNYPIYRKLSLFPQIQGGDEKNQSITFVELKQCNESILK